VAQKSVALVSFLIENGVHLERTNQVSKCLIIPSQKFNSFYSLYQHGATPLLFALNAFDTYEIASLLIEKGASVQKSDHV
jgi:hypothetical protein